MFERILLGDNPFIGVNHLSQDKARDTLSKLNSQRIAQVMRTAFSSGADGFVFSTHPTHLEVFQVIKTQDMDVAFDMYPLLPYAQEYVRIATEKGMVGLLTDVMQRLSWGGKVKAIIGGGLSALTMDPYRMISTYVDAELNSFLNAAPENARLKGVFLHEIIVDLAVSLGLKDVFSSYISNIQDKYHVKPGFVTRNLERFVHVFEQNNLPLGDVIVMTPFNKVGYQMNPSRESSERVLERIPSMDVIAMSILSAGLLKLEDAIDYIRNVRNLRSLVVGVSTEEHARKTFSALRELKGIEEVPNLTR